MFSSRLAQRHVVNKNNAYFLSVTASDPDGDAVAFRAVTTFPTTGNSVTRTLSASRGSGKLVVPFQFVALHLVEGDRVTLENLIEQEIPFTVSRALPGPSIHFSRSFSVHNPETGRSEPTFTFDIVWLSLLMMKFDEAQCTHSARDCCP